MSIPNYYGDVSKITSNTIEVPARSWGLQLKGNNRDATNSKQGRYRVPGGVIDASGTIKVVIDFDDPPTQLPTDGSPGTPHPGLRIGSVVDLELYLNDTVFFALTAIIDDCTCDTDPESTEPQEFTVTWSLQDQSSLTWPVGF